MLHGINTINLCVITMSQCHNVTKLYSQCSGQDADGGTHLPASTEGLSESIKLIKSHVLK